MRIVQWSKFSREELERRRKISVEVLKDIDHEKFERWYQEVCDRLYWQHGQCCAGCDHWESSGGRSGLCRAAGIVSGADVLRSMGIESSSYMPPPGFPYTEEDFHCGEFSDAFDWSELEVEYLVRIGAYRNGKLRDKPTKGR